MPIGRQHRYTNILKLLKIAISELQVDHDYKYRTLCDFVECNINGIEKLCPERCTEHIGDVQKQSASTQFRAFKQLKNYGK